MSTLSLNDTPDGELIYLEGFPIIRTTTPCDCCKICRWCWCGSDTVAAFDLSTVRLSISITEFTYTCEIDVGDPCGVLHPTYKLNSFSTTVDVPNDPNPDLSLSACFGYPLFTPVGPITITFNEYYLCSDPYGGSICNGPIERVCTGVLNLVISLGNPCSYVTSDGVRLPTTPTIVGSGLLLIPVLDPCFPSVTCPPEYPTNGGAISCSPITMDARITSFSCDETTYSATGNIVLPVDNTVVGSITVTNIP